VKRIAILAATAFLSWSTPALGGNPNPGICSADGDGIELDNCCVTYNPNQDDTDGDDCGNLCDADYDQNGIVDYADFGMFAACFGLTGCAEQQHVEPISDAMTVDFGDFGYFASAFVGGRPPGPSGTTIGTIACP
jgi:hypothetical protein